MKKIVDSYIQSLGGQTHYSGKARIMFINDPNKGVGLSIQHKTELHFSNLPFTLKTN